MMLTVIYIYIYIPQLYIYIYRAHDALSGPRLTAPPPPRLPQPIKPKKKSAKADAAKA
jgi:hypothetical protein